MAAEGLERTSATDDTLADASRGEEVCDEETAVRTSGNVQRQTAAEDIVNSLSLSEHTCSLLHFERGLKKQHLFQLVLLSVGCLLFMSRKSKSQQKFEEHSTINVFDIRAAFPLSEAIHCRLKKLFATQDIAEWLKLLPQTVKVDEVIEFIFVQAEQQLILVAEVESLKCRKEAFELLLEENKQLLTLERRRIRKIELEKAEIGELESRLRCEVEHLRKVVVQLNERISVLLGELEQLKKREAEGDVEVKEAEVLKQKWEMERQELQLRVSELEAAQQLRRNKQLVQGTEGEEAELATEGGEARAAATALREELAKVQKELSGSKEKAAILIEMCKQNESRIEELVMENAKLKSQLSTVDRTSQSYDIATILKENSNLRAALKTVEQMKMEVENEKVAVQDQLLEYQRKCGVFDKPRPPVATYKTASNRTGAGRARTFADGVVRATVAPSTRTCPFCKAYFGQLESDESDFMHHVNNCQGLAASEEIAGKTLS